MIRLSIFISALVMISLLTGCATERKKTKCDWVGPGARASYVCK
jgi:hypothetical protein